MFNKTTILLLVAILFSNTQMLIGQSDPVARDRTIKARVNKLGPGAKVTVFLKDGTKVRGTISQVHEDSFDVTILKQTQSSVISFRDVQNVRKRGWSNAAVIGVSVGVGILVVIVGIGAAVAASGPF